MKRAMFAGALVALLVAGCSAAPESHAADAQTSGLVAPNERKVRIEVGYDLESRITDLFASRVIRELILPRFREGDMAEGIMAGSEAIVARLNSPQLDREFAMEGQAST